MTHQEITLPSLGDERRDHDAIERAAAPLVAQGFEPIDAEPGEWLRLRKGYGQVIDIAIRPAEPCGHNWFDKAECPTCSPFGLRLSPQGRWQLYDRRHINRRTRSSYLDLGKAQRSQARYNEAYGRPAAAV